MEKWVCIPCDYIYEAEIGDVESGILAGTKFEDIPEDWVCPICGVGKDQFEKR
ncbi:MAG: rubredoxin [Fusobacteriaceae bacterium]